MIMSGAPKAIQARYADWRPVKGRKVLQIVLEVPLEQQNEVLKLLGAPLPDRDLWVAVAVLSDEVGKIKGGNLSKSAAIICTQGAFWQWSGATNADEAADYIRTRCNVTSRAMIDHDEKAAREFRDMSLEYEAWLRIAA
jgi:hypothetical protein